MRKYVSLIIIAILALSSLITIRPASSQITKPSVPEFTLKLVHHSLDQPAISTIDPYTGENTTIAPAKHDEWTSTVVTIKNQPFTPYKDSNGNQIELFYNVRSKGHFSEIWVERYTAEEGYPIPSNSAYTIIDYVVDYPVNAQIDFQVQALIGYNTRITDAWTPYGEEYHYVFNGESSGWSNTQILNFGDGSTTTNPETTPSSSPTPTVSPSQNSTTTPDQSGPQSLTVLGLDGLQVTTVTLLGIIAALLVFVVIFLHKRSVNNKPGK